ncbi:MAG: chemotaxis protein CheW [Planctomycetes bacterium]|nr:chemotaxis protein CheW [Planctomycetota bacterium]
MLVLMCEAGGHRYAIDTSHVVEVVSHVRSQRVVEASERSGDMFAYRGRATPLVDLSLLTTGEPCPRRWNSRIIIARAGAEDHHQRFGLLAERVTTAVIDGQIPDRPASDCSGLSATGPVLLDEHGMFRLVDPTRLLGADGRDVLAPIEPEGTS